MPDPDLDLDHLHAKLDAALAQVKLNAVYRRWHLILDGINALLLIILIWLHVLMLPILR